MGQEDQQEQQGDVAKSSTSLTIQQKVAEEIKGSGSNVQNFVVKELVDIEVRKRTDLAIKGLAELDKQRKEFAKINKPDIQTFVRPGAPGEGSYSAERNKAITDGQAKLNKLANALDAALDKNDGDSYGKLAELLK